MPEEKLLPPPARWIKEFDDARAQLKANEEGIASDNAMTILATANQLDVLMRNKEVRQEKRTALGKKLGFDAGIPYELIQEEDGSARRLPTGETIERRDALGLLVDPAIYAKRSCNKCYGRGVITLHQPVGKEQAEKMRADRTASALLHEGKKNRAPAIRETERCMCAVLGYAKAVTKFTEALLKEGLAKRVGWTRDNEQSLAREQIELV